MKEISLNDHIRRTARSREKAILVGTVTKVYDKPNNIKTTGNIEVDVVTKRVVGAGESTATHKFERVPVVNTDHSGHVAVPQEDDQVLVDWTMGRGREPLVIGQSYTDEPEYRAPNARAGHWRHEFRRDKSDLLYLEAVPAKEDIKGDPEKLRMGVKPGPLKQPDTAVEIDDSEPTTHVTVKTDGDITIETTDDKDISVQTAQGNVNVQSEDGDVDVNTTNGDVDVSAGGDAHVSATNTLSLDGDTVTINTSSGPQPVAPLSHTHDVDDTQEDGSTTTRETTEPNQAGTETEIG